ncbi:hypothetical protein [Halobellus ordinarius]|uniref:hypothetical protein n=1 Tax=Halobellus ordinarius TaxID=3075120 RepID=UPI0028800EE5|nr:hypothetical protein [Halobellus sp. ZY16]
MCGGEIAADDPLVESALWELSGKLQNASAGGHHKALTGPIEFFGTQMVPPFLTTKPLQACKLLGVVTTAAVLFGIVFEIVPTESITVLFFVPVVAFVFAVVITAETVLAGYHVVQNGTSFAERFSRDPLYGVVRIGEFLFALLAVGAVGVILVLLPDGPMAGPGALGLFYILVGLSLLILFGSLVRSITEYVRLRRGKST